jgi:hypothetical protein
MEERAASTFILKMKARGHSEMSVIFYQTLQHHTPLTAVAFRICDFTGVCCN